MSQGMRSARFLIVAMLGCAGLVFADVGTPVKHVAPGTKLAKQLAENDPDTTDASGANRSASTHAGVAAPANDTCAGATALQLNQAVYGTTVDANDDYQSPDTPACFPGDGQALTKSTGRDVVYSFTAPSAGKYTFRTTARYGSSAIYSQNVVLYLTDCANAGTVECIKGGNSRYQQTNPGSLGQSHGLSESVDCQQMGAGETTYLILDDGPPGRCSDNNHMCVDDSYCAAGATCVPQINVGGDFSLEVIPCEEEVEPNDTPATASAFSCGVTGASGVAPVAHCYLGDRAGSVCTRPYASVSYLDQANPDSNMRCAGSGAMCILDVPTGTDNCAVGTGPCQQQTDLDCDPRCDSGPNVGKSCSTHAFCNPVSDQGATCAGACVVENTCVVTATGVDTGVPCNSTCQGSTIPSVNGRACTSAANYNACPGGGTCTTTALDPLPGAQCVTGQTCTRVFNEGDTDYFSVGSPVAGSKVFTAVWANNANDFDYRMRVTNATNTLQFDDNDAVSFFGSSVSSVIGGAVTDGTPTFIQVSRTIPRTTKTYQVYGIVRPPLAAAQLEDESGPNGNDQIYIWPANVINANPLGAGGYVRGSMNFAGDTDCFKFLVNKGDLIDMYGDGGPARGTGTVATVSNPFPLYEDAEPAGISGFVFGTEVKKNLAADVQGPGLRALSPAVTSDYVQWRASYSGLVSVCYYDLRNFYTTSGPQTYPTPWAGSVSVNCGPLQDAGPGTTTADVSVTKTGPAGPVATGDFIEYTIAVTNNGTEIAQEVALDDTLDPNLTFISLTVDDTLGGNNVACFSLPTAGINDAPIYCINASMAPGTTTTYVITAQVNNCIGDDVVIDNTATITTVSTDPDPGNDSATASFTTVAAANNGCTDIDCSGAECVPNLCTTNEHCDAGACVTDAVVCDDNSLCTDDSCDAAVGCVFDPSQAGDLCDDFNACTANQCDPLLFCVFPPEPASTVCDDGLACSLSDACDGTGICVGASVCDDSNPCTDDFADEVNACACSHTPVAGGTSCEDGKVCTGTVAVPDACDGAGLCVGGAPVVCDDGDACNGSETCDSANGCVPGTPLSCDDGSVCTTDTCDPAQGCVYTPISCDDGSACTNDSCDPITGCSHGPVTCDDGSVCTTDSCDPATGCVYTPVSCDDGSACTTDSCDPATGCVYTPVTCDDGSACTTDSCDPATGCVTTPVTCDDGSACTTDSCDPATGCVTTPVTCDDGNACNGVETCNPASGCVAGTAPVCNDGNACNGVETCNPATGCVAGTAPVCNDGNACNGVETCNPASGCVGGTALVCNDGNACNGVETCNPASGCVGGTALVCNDGNACNGVETCNPASGCVAGSAVVCSASDQCHAVGTCDSGTGACSNPPKPAGTACDDGDFCTTIDLCNAAGTCLGGAALSCPSDAAVCTAEVCDPTIGCVHSDINLDVSNFSDTRVDGLDLAVLAAAWNSCPVDVLRYNAAANLDRLATPPGVCIGATDFHLFMNAFGRSCQ